MSDDTIDLYATHADLVREVGSERRLRALLPAVPDVLTDPTRGARQAALRDIFKSLARRTPPVYESDISIPGELTDAVVYGTLMRLYFGATTVKEDTNWLHYEEYKSKFESEVTNLRITVSDAASLDTFSIPMFRR